ncbi:hypothetical protein INN71_02785 [Nocardioides sp. ChNu-153]|uniref:hypothetical protein n=1 Tax=Nocardioides sp. ChNu-153 TaxID=2779364 RepID=UPI00264CE11C|nr:hypothetical protein [Nocardioides sp. ChNu-153]MDN7120312.1 hypothetical protein [Nocardioides sp. ChNu-153]
MPLTENGIWHPDETTPARGWPDFKELAESVDEAISLSTSDNGYVRDPFDGNITVHRQGKIVVPVGTMTLPDEEWTGAGWVHAFYVPVGYGPAGTWLLPWQPLSSGVIYRVRVDPDRSGHVQMTGPHEGTMSLALGTWVTP